MAAVAQAPKLRRIQRKQCHKERRSTMIHEKQIRQLCAIHAVNNLLQLPHDFVGACCDSDNAHDDSNININSGSQSNTLNEHTCDTVDVCKSITRSPQQGYITIHKWTCCGRIVHHYPYPRRRRPSDVTEQSTRKNTKTARWYSATQSEFDDIATEFTLRERALMTEGDVSESFSDANNNADETLSTTKSLSMMQKMSSQYGTPYFGNYSLEVIQTALQRRGVEMSFFRVTDDINASINITDSITSSENKKLVGFILHVQQEEERTVSSYLRSFGSHLPLVRNFCVGGKHWYVITRMKYNSYQGHGLDDRRTDPNATIANESSYKSDTLSSSSDGNSENDAWYLIDSNTDDVEKFEEYPQVLEYLRNVQSTGGLVFRAMLERETGESG